MTKYKLSRKAWAIVACMLLASFWVSCKDDLGAVGLGVLPKGDIIYSSEKTDKNIQAYTQTVNSVETERAGSYLLGCLNDPHVGKTTADFAIQMRIPGHPNFEKDAVLDSVTLTLPYHEVYGDTSVLVPPLSQPMRIRVHELSQDLDYDHKYPSNTDLNSMSKSESLIYGASYFEYRPFMRWDDRTTKYYKQIQTIHIRLSDEFGKRLMAIDSTQMLSNDRFVKVFKGLHISVDDQNSGKSSLVRINPSLSTTNSSSVTTTESFEIRLYKKSPTSGRTDTIVYYTVGQLSASVNHFAHDYSKTRFANKLNNEAEVDSFIYVQPMAGLRSRINIPNLKNWKDSSIIIINKAKVTF
ncbi:MAG: DUF4270 family protein, partial [Bacteroidota bacterium]|nr:DUF4270 family protein [Bacteroidota bacterium]